MNTLGQPSIDRKEWWCTDDNPNRMIDAIFYQKRLSKERCLLPNVYWDKYLINVANI